MGVGKETRALWKVSSPADVVAGSRAVMNRGVVQGLVLGGQWGGPE